MTPPWRRCDARGGVSSTPGRRGWHVWGGVAVTPPMSTVSRKLSGWMLARVAVPCRVVMMPRVQRLSSADWSQRRPSFVAVESCRELIETQRWGLASARAVSSSRTRSSASLRVGAMVARRWAAVGDFR
jgi:hypothetical protein